MKPESRKLLFDIEQACQRLIDFSAGRTLKDYLSDVYFQSAVERQFQVAGEALKRLLQVDESAPKCISEHRNIIGFRNILSHGYDIIDPYIVWDSLTNKVPTLLNEVKALLKEDKAE
ncbi:MAG: DUF86 domain-containing protein [Candidatus Hydrogenedentes bacterium]|nr:DUF86 domain-containing protein [Candidatus Hydrogenedentota bacterium]